MSKKHRKIFKQKMSQMLANADKISPVDAEAPSRPANKPVSVSATHSVFVKSDLKKIAFLFGIMLLIIALIFLLSLKTNWLTILADKIYELAQLGAQLGAQ